MCFNRWIHCFIGLNDDIHCDLFTKWIHWMIWFQMGTLWDLSLSWIHLMVLEFVVKKFEWHPKFNVLWVFKWKPRVWVVEFGLVDSLALVPFNLHISFHLFYLIFCSWIKLQTFGTRLKWGWLNKTPIFDHFPVDSTSHLNTLYCKRFVHLRVLIKTHKINQRPLLLSRISRSKKSEKEKMYLRGVLDSSHFHRMRKVTIYH
jgi:hypothetical protein